MKKLVILVLALIAEQTFYETSLQAQNLEHYKQIVKELSSSKYQGRGYAKGGANKAGEYLKKEFTKAGVDEVICQPFTIDINTFPKNFLFLHVCNQNLLFSFLFFSHAFIFA